MRHGAHVLCFDLTCYSPFCTYQPVPEGSAATKNKTDKAIPRAVRTIHRASGDGATAGRACNIHIVVITVAVASVVIWKFPNIGSVVQC